MYFSTADAKEFGSFISKTSASGTSNATGGSNVLAQNALNKQIFTKVATM